MKTRVLFCLFLFVSAGNAAAEWHFVETGVDTPINDIQFMNEDTGWAVGDNAVILKTDDGGETWFRQECPDKTADIKRLEFVTSETGYAYCLLGPLLKTVDGGETWSIVETKVSGRDSVTTFSGSRFDNCVNMSFVDENTGWVIGDNGGQTIYVTRDGGKTWEISIQLFRWAQITGLDFFDKNNGWALFGDYHDGFASTYLMHTSDGGGNWVDYEEFLGLKFIVQAKSREEIWVSSGGLGVSRDGGVTFENIGLGNTYPGLRNVHIVDSMTLYGWFNSHLKDYNSIEYSEDGGHTYTLVAKVQNEFSAPWPNFIAGYGHMVFIPGKDGRILKYTRDDVSVDGRSLVSVTPFTLGQNTPNPFNPLTSIPFTLTRGAHVRLDIYDISGRLVSTLMDTFLQAGSYSADFNGKGMSSGIYFYRLVGGNETKTGRMTLVK